MQKPSGFTLMEMVIVLAVMALVIIAAPALSTRLGRQGVVLAVDQLSADIQLARVMAIKHKSPCAIALSSSHGGQWRNTISGQSGSLTVFKGGVHFLGQGPDGRPAASEIVFSRRGLSASVVPRDIFLADDRLSRIFRIRIRLPGAISVHRWVEEEWR